MNKCPKCKNENLVENQKFCQICGLDLIEVNITKEEALEFFKFCYAKARMKEDFYWCSIAKYAIEALEKDITKTTSKEQDKPRIAMDFGTGKFKRIRLYNKKEDFEEAYLKSNKKLGLLLTPGILRANKINSIDETFILGFFEDEEE